MDAGAGTSLRSLTFAQWQRAQRRLNDLGYRGERGVRVPVSGHFGPHTRMALNSFRSRNGITRTNNQMRYRDRTWNRLMRSIPSVPRRAFNQSQTTARPVDAGGGGSRATFGPPAPPRNNNQTTNRNNSNTAQAVTGDQYETPVSLRILGRTIRVPRWIVNRLQSGGGSSSNSSNVRAASASTELMVDGNASLENLGHDSSMSIEAFSTVVAGAGLGWLTLEAIRTLVALILLAIGMVWTVREVD